MTDLMARPSPRGTLPAHLAPLDRDDWAMWRWSALRGAGFPIDQVTVLGDAALAAVADRCIDAVDAAAAAGRAPAPPPSRKPSGRPKSGAGQGPPPLPEEEEYARAFEAGVERATAALRDVIGAPSFREALAWQNRRALHNGVDYLLRRSEPGRRPSRQRQNEALVTNYLQRYCAKNDTIGFFGPVGWARITDDGPAVAVEPGPSLLAKRTTYFEGWCIGALCEVLSRDEGILPWIAPRRMPYLRLEGTSVRPPLAPLVPLTPAQVAAFQCCDGQRSARDVAALLLADPSLGLRTEEDVYGVLRRLRATNWIAWQVEVPAEGMFPERTLRAVLGRVGDEPRRAAAIAALDELVAARDAVAAAAGDADEVDRSMADLEATFVRLTDTGPTRRDGEVYSGRQLVYEDCRRDVDVRLGPELLAGLGPAMSIVLDAARWVTAEAADLYRQAYRDVYAQLARKSGPVVPFSSFWFLAHHLVFDEHSPLLDTLSQRLRERWAQVLTVPPDARRVELDVADLRPRVDRAFAIPRRGWRTGIYHSPDLMLAADGPDGLAEGRFHYVLGEIHPAVNTLRPALFGAQHPAPDDLIQAVERDMPEPLVIPVASRGPGGVTLRITRGFSSPKDHRLLVAADSCGVSAGKPLAAGLLDVEEVGDTLEVRTRNGGLRFDVLDVMGDLVSLQVLHIFEIVPPAAHTPRISFGPLVVSRETWRFPRADIAFALVQDEPRRFLEARRWMRAHGMPRFVFFKIQADDKPVFVDFESVLSIDVLARAIRRPSANGEIDGTVTVSEMLPTPDQAWLVDAEGHRYASEMRMVCVDRQPWS